MIEDELDAVFRYPGNRVVARSESREVLQEGAKRGPTRRKEGQDFQQGQTAGIDHIVQIFTALREIKFCRSYSDNEIASRIGGTFMMIY